jgi:hypothetical protein
MKPGETLPCNATSGNATMFQSAPGNEAGRNVMLQWKNGVLQRFQSAPGNEAGRNIKRPAGNMMLAALFQSAPGNEAGRNIAVFSRLAAL